MNNTTINPILSVIIPVYNVETYLERCLNSVIRQSYSNLEIICVNDGSTDGSLRILENYAKRDSRIKIVCKSNGGLVSARKVGIQTATGVFATYVDSDDYIDQGMYSKLMDIMLEYDVDVVTSGCIRDYGEKKVLEPEDIQNGLYCDERLQVLLGNLIATDKFFKYNLSCHVYNKIYKTSLLRKYQLRVLDDISVGEDAAVIYPLISDAKSVYVSGYNYYHYCVRADSVMGAPIVKNDDTLYKMLKYVADSMSDANGSINNLFKKQYTYFKTYMKLLRDPTSVLRYCDGYLYPYGFVSKDERIILYGAGKFGVAIKQFLVSNGFNNVVWVDQNVKKENVIKWEEARNKPYDKIIVSALLHETVQSIIDIIKIDSDNDKLMYIKEINRE